MKKRISCVILSLLMAVVSISCGKSANNAELSTEENIFYELEVSTFMPWESEEEDIPEGELASDDIRREVNNLAKDILGFINSTYSTGWEYVDKDVYTFEGDPYYGGGYCHTDGNLYFNKNFIYGNIEKGFQNPKLKNVVVHEVIHGITDENRGAPFFYKWYSDDSVLGGYLHEAVTELLTEEYLRYIGIQLKDVYSEGMSSGYAHIVYYLRAMDAAIPGAMEDILSDNMSELEKRVEEKAENDEAFDRWLFFLDITQVEHINCIMGEEDAINPFIMVYATTEFMERISDEEVLLKEINNYFDKAFGLNSGEQFCYSIEEAKEIMLSLVEEE